MGSSQVPGVDDLLLDGIQPDADDDNDDRDGDRGGGGPRPISIIMIDEIDMLTPPRGRSSEITNRTTNELLTLLDGIRKDFRDGFVIVGTNHVGNVDSALCDRFPLRIYVDNELSASAARAIVPMQLERLVRASAELASQRSARIDQCARDHPKDPRVKQANAEGRLTLRDDSPPRTTLEDDELLELFGYDARSDRGDPRLARAAARIKGNSPAEVRSMFDRAFQRCGQWAYGCNAWCACAFGFDGETCERPRPAAAPGEAPGDAARQGVRGDGHVPRVADDARRRLPPRVLRGPLAVRRRRRRRRRAGRELPARPALRLRRR